MEISESGKKTVSELIIDALRQDDFIRTPEITALVARESGRDIKIQDIASILTKITNYKTSDIACLIEKRKSRRGYAYRLVREALKLSPEQTYDLARKTRKNKKPRFTLDQAVELYPELGRHVNSGCRANGGRDRAKQAEGRSSLPVYNRSGANAGSHLSSLLSGMIDQGCLKINLNLNVYVSGPKEGSALSF